MYFIEDKSTNNNNIRFKILQCAYVIKRILSVLHISTILSYLSTYNTARMEARAEVLTNEACTEALTNDEINGINMFNMELKDKGNIHSNMYVYMFICIYVHIYAYVCIHIYVYVNIDTYIHMYTYIYTYTIYIYICINTNF
jgi:hypothetical protein